MAKRPTFRRGNPRARRVQVPPPGIDLEAVARSCRYVGSPYHKGAAGYAGAPRGPRPDATKCPRELVDCRETVEEWLRAAVRAGRVGAWDGGYPRYVWHREGDVVFEARHGSLGSGEYHGYPLQPNQRIQGLG